ncbi:MAG: lysostaphin resistance A-like protein [Candidatus Binatia bacterium]
MAKSFLVVIEGFVVLVVTHWVCAEYLALRLLQINSNIPWVTAGVISSTVSPLVGAIYMGLRLRHIPLISIKAQTFLTAAVAILLAWLAVFLQTLVLGKEIPFAQEILQTGSQPRYFYVTLFIVVAWGPFLEETLNRGYFFETLRRTWGHTVSLLISSFLFVSFHGIFDVIQDGKVGYDLLFILLDSVIFTLAYIRGGLVAAILTHMFVNFYLTYLNMYTEG